MSREGPFWDVMEGRKPPPPRGREEFLNPLGVVQGGFVAAMLDDTLGPALVCTLPPGQFAPTVELKVNFIRPAPLGALIGEGRVVAQR
jgi:uncharacterized protein (TIGR00369 family)